MSKKKTPEKPKTTPKGRKPLGDQKLEVLQAAESINVEPKPSKDSKSTPKSKDSSTSSNKESKQDLN